MTFPFEDLKIYQDSLNFVSTVNRLSILLNSGLKRAYRDQLGRAALSIPLNIAEGNGRWHNGEKRQFYRIARGSIFECVAIIQSLEKSGLISEVDYADCYRDLVQLSKMISGLIKAVELRSRINLNEICAGFDVREAFAGPEE